VTVNQSVFTTGCVYNRRSITMNTTARDAYGLPPAFHSAQIITDDNGSTPTVCDQQGDHNTDACAIAQPFDQDALGGSLERRFAQAPSASASVGSFRRNLAKYYPEGSKIQARRCFYPFSTSRILRSARPTSTDCVHIATSQGNRYCAVQTADCLRFDGNADVTPNGSQAVLFYDLTNSSDNVKLNTIKGFGHTAGSCPNRSLVVVVVGAGTVFPSGPALVASVFVTTPGKTYSATGGVMVGAVYAERISLGGQRSFESGCADLRRQQPEPHVA
jgi:hypothetical protein